MPRHRRATGNLASNCAALAALDRCVAVSKERDLSGQAIVHQGKQQNYKITTSSVLGGQYVEAVPFAVLGLARCFIDSARVLAVDLVIHCASSDCSAGLHIRRGVYTERHQLYHMR